MTETENDPPIADPNAVELEWDAAMHAWLSCLVDAAWQDDDHRSDAVSVAVGIKARCHSAYMAFIETYTRGMNYQARAWLEDRMAASDQELGMATDVVLKERRAQDHPPRG